MTTTTTRSAREQAPEKSKFQKFTERFKLNSHYEIERFGVISIAILLVGALIMALAAVVAFRGTRANISDTAIYTETFISSRTSQTGEVNGLFTNDDNTRAVLMFSFDTPENMSLDPADYEIFVTGVGSNDRAERVKTAMSGSILSFGDTGIMGVMLDAPGGFEMQVLNVTVGANKELADTRLLHEDDRIELGYDESFTTTDQWRMVFNPAASQANWVGTLNDELPDMRNFYNDTVMINREKEARRELDEILSSMKVAQDRISTFYEQTDTRTARVDGDPMVRLVPPLPPAEIAGDVVEGEGNEEVARIVNEAGGPDVVLQNPEATGLDTIMEKSIRAQSLDYDPDGYVPNTYELLTTSVIEGGYNFDWRSRTIEEGYLDGVVPAGVEAEAYLRQMANLKPEDPKIDRDNLMLSNGRFLSDYDLTDSQIQPLGNLGNNLIQAYDRFYDLKSEYQRVGLQQLLMLEAELNQVAANIETSSEEDQVTFRR